MGTMIGLFQKGDQAILDAFADITIIKRGRRPSKKEELKFILQDVDERCPEIDYYIYSVKPKRINAHIRQHYKEQDYYTFNFFTNTNDDYKDQSLVGFEGQGLRILGKAKFNDQEEKVIFVANVKKFILSAEVVDEVDPDILTLNKKAKRIVSKFEFEIFNASIQN